MKKTFLLIFIVGVLGVAGYVFFHEVVEKVSAPASSEDPGARKDWKLYTFRSHPFAFSHPKEWEAYEVEPGIAVLVKDAAGSRDLGSVSINVAAELPYLRAVEEVQSNFETSEMRNVVIGGLPGIEIRGFLREDIPENGGRKAVFTMLDYGGRLVSIDYIETDWEAGDLREAYQDIAASLARFTRQNF